MARKPVTDMSAWPSLTLEGNLIAPAMVASIDRRQAPEQTEEDYRIRKGLTIREEISTAFRVGQSHFDAFAKLQNPSLEATRRFVRAFLAETFGFDDLVPADDVISFLAGGRIPIVIVPPSEEKLDRRSPTLSTDRSRSPAFALQDCLNDSDDALWGLVTNGAVIRLMRDNASLTRPAYIEADLAAIFTSEDAASFAVLWSLVHRTRFGIAGTPVTDCALERWREAGSREGEAARDRLAAQVETALKVLGSGFLEANPNLAARLKSGEVNLTEWFNELLRLVYRLIFLMVAEDRNLLHPETAKPDVRKLYAEGYSLAALRTQCARAAIWDKHHDRYEGIKVVFRALAHGQETLGLPALGGLFGAGMLPHLEPARLRNRAFMEALYRLSWLSDRAGMIPVNWRAMETEELGSVYESLLELQPQLGDDGKTLTFASEAAEQKGNQRKTTGSYYTPDSLVQALLDTALDPVLNQTESEAADPAGALLKLSVIDPACGSGHFLLAAARRIATRLARIRAEGTPSLADFRHALRDVARCCIYGVDRNPMAVELTKVALWIETVDPGLPLGFFDAQIRCGDALLGVFDLKVLERGIPDDAYKPLAGDDKEVARHFAQKNRREKGEKDRIAKGFGFDRISNLMRDFETLRAMPENTVDEIEAKAARLHSLTAEGASAWQLETACDLYVSAFLLPKMKGGPHAGPDGMPRRGAEAVPTSGTVWEWLRGVQPFGPTFSAAIDAARTARTFHWPLEFPDVMQRGGFDLVLGNPPWDKLSPDHKEFFSIFAPEVRFMSPSDQKVIFEQLLEDVSIAMRWDKYCRDLYAAVHFMKTSGRYRLFASGDLGKGDFNAYRLFVETALSATKKGRIAAQLVPEGLYNGANATAIREELLEKFQLEKLAGFENTKGIWFPSIDTRSKFCLYVAKKQEKTDAFRASFRINSRDRLSAFLLGHSLEIPKDLLLQFSPDAKTVMEFVAQEDIDVCTKMYSAYPTFGAKIDGLYYRDYMREIDMTNNQSWFTEDDGDIPLYEGRMIDLYDYRAKRYVSGRGRAANWEDLTFDDPGKRIAPQWHIRRDAIAGARKQRMERFRIAYGWVASPTNQRSLITTIVPAGVICGNSVPTILLENGSDLDQLLFVGCANSLCMDFVVRKRVSLNLAHSIVDTLPFPRNFRTTPAAQEIANRVFSLCAVGEEMEVYRQELWGRNCIPKAQQLLIDPEHRAAVSAEIDVLVAREVYGLTEREMLYILDPDNILGRDCGVETFKALRNREQREFGEFRTQRLIEQAWDRLKVAEVRPTLADLPNGAWARATQQPGDAGAALTAILKAVDGPTPSRTIRLAAAMMLESHLLTSLLPDARAQEWRRLVGQEAEPRTGNVVGFAARTNQGWSAAVSNHRGNGRLIENISAGTWAPGPGLEAFDTAGWPDGRAGFVLEALSALDLDTTVTSMPGEVRGWIAHAATA
ncbi:putative type I restriction enzymeP M protein [bacterium YEK0313]|nr:putative type I restriction enzymeP M protein [bacterium YEK0313]